MPEEVKLFFQHTGSIGGKKRSAALSPEARKASADRAIRARWAKYRRDRGLPPKPGDEEFLSSE